MSRVARNAVLLGSTPSAAAASGLDAAAVLALIESSLGETTVEQPSTGLGSSVSPFGFFPSAGHINLPSRAPANFATYLLSR